MELQGAAPSTIYLLYCAVALVGLSLLWRAAKTVLWQPWANKKSFEKQGVKCLPYHVLIGNMRELLGLMRAAKASPIPLSNEIITRVAPQYYHWKKKYGNNFVYWFGYQAVLFISNPEIGKEIFSNKFGHFRKFTIRDTPADLSGESVPSLEGERWAQHRRIVSPAFFVEKLKVMTPTMLACIHDKLNMWESQLDGQLHSKELDVSAEFKVLTADIIAHTGFGSSYEEGKRVFELQQEQASLLIKLLRLTFIPGARYLPTFENRCARRLRKEIDETLEKMIRSREETHNGSDLLGILLAANRMELSGSQKNLSLSMKEIVDECKTFFIAGHETTASLMTWTIMLLAIHSDWQEKAREEVLRVCGKESPTYDCLHSLKTVGMILNETLRLYPPAPFLVREATKKITVGKLSVPADTMLLLPILEWHTDPAWWGDDALDFNPQRFVDGISGACKTPSAFCPFSMGPRVCLGQNFAMLEARAILASMLPRFSFTLSPGYTHCPITVLTLQPQNGMPIIFKKLE